MAERGLEAMQRGKKNTDRHGHTEWVKAKDKELSRWRMSGKYRESDRARQEVRQLVTA